MNAYTEALWELLDETIDNDAVLLEDLTKMLFKEYKPFLTAEQTLTANINALKSYFLDHLNKLIEWLPQTTINALFSVLVEEAVKEVSWSYVAGMLQERLAIPVKETAHADDRAKA